MKNLDYLKLDEVKVAAVVDSLNNLLANLQVYYANLRGSHWNVKGKGFFILHAKYEELYDDAAAKVDEVAERILQLGGVPENRPSVYTAAADVRESGNVPAGKDGILEVLDTTSLLIAKEREIAGLAGETGDNVTAALMDDYLKGQEKLVWMLLAFLEKKPEGCCK